MRGEIKFHLEEICGILLGNLLKSHLSIQINVVWYKWIVPISFFTLHFFCTIYITLTSQWPRWRLKSPALRLFTQSFIQAQIKENIKAPRHWPLCGEFTGAGEFPAQRASNAENVSIWWRHHEYVGFMWRNMKMHFNLLLLYDIDR